MRSGIMRDRMLKMERRCYKTRRVNHERVRREDEDRIRAEMGPARSLRILEKGDICF